MLLLGEGSKATEPYNKYDKIRPHSFDPCNSIKRFDLCPFDKKNSIKRFDLCPFDKKNSTYLQPPNASDWLKICNVNHLAEYIIEVGQCLDRLNRRPVSYYNLDISF